jgi:hypothetical protein
MSKPQLARSEKLVGSSYYYETGCVNSPRQFFRLTKLGLIKMFFIGKRLAQYQDEADRQIAAIIAASNPPEPA